MPVREQRGPVDFPQALEVAARLPGVRIDRATYLREALGRVCPAAQVEVAVSESPSVAGIPIAVLDAAAVDSIRLETTRVTVLSGVAGMPGGLVIAATIPADMAQYLGHMLRISQKLAYLYGWPDLLDGEGVDDGTRAVLTLFVGVMMGAGGASAAVGQLAGIVAEQVAKKLPQAALTKGAVYPVVKSVAALLGVKMTKHMFARGISKIVPVIGGFVSGGITLATFVPMSNRLKEHLSQQELARLPRVAATVAVEHGDAGERVP